MSHRAARTAQQGFALLEVLVTLVLLTMGTLGVVGLLLHARQANEQSLAYTRATLLAEGMLERIRANPTAAGLAIYSAPAPISPATTAPPGSDCRTGNCTPAQLAHFDLYDWAQHIASRDTSGQQQDGLPGARGCITIRPADPEPGTMAQATIVLAWQGTGGGRTAAPDEGPVNCASDGLGAGRQFVALTTGYVVDT
ncbi:type IV pilus modification protein PilV [Kushneria sinocarnis]|uniref:Type IV pilus modification protein PilV n=1 Tax=Kushneria sinocarnis TaxID=595502 RepID=A0A420WT91_9GAMM|nr:type IV pilus modification protein PilV [Kushneria sinocarnis]RKQ95844.1 type IV pilus modification protein PilV [Kushneria sinocarnis]